MGEAATMQSGLGPGALPSIFSEQFSDALRNDCLDEFRAGSPAAACLLPLLEALGWHKSGRDLIEAMPHFAEDLDLVDLRNILVSLGYESTSSRRKIANVKAELYPCLFVENSGRLLVLLDTDKSKVRFFDPQSNTVKDDDIRGKRGTVFYFTDIHPTHSVSAGRDNYTHWFANLLGRFRSLVIHALGMSLVINLIALTVPLFVMLIYDKVIGTKSPETLPYLVSGIGILLVADMVLRFVRARLLGWVAGRMDYLIGVEVFRQLIYLPLQNTERTTVPAQLSTLRQFDSIRDFFTGPGASIGLELPFVFLYIVVIALVAGWIALIPLAMIVTYALFGLYMIPELARRVRKSGAARTDKQRLVMQTLLGRREIKSIGGETVWWERFRETSGDVVMANHDALTANSVLNSVAQGIMTLAGIAVISFGTLAVIDGSLTIGGLIATMALVWRCLSPLQSLFLIVPQIQQMKKAVKQINQLMRMTPEQHTARGGIKLDTLSGRIHADRLSFRYGPNDDPALLGITFDIEPGEMVAICGNTGSGKSTLLKLITGLYRPQAGNLSIDDLDIRQLNSMELRRAIAYVPQETRMFYGTIAQNMRLNNGLATDSDLHQAAANAGVLEDILKLARGFDTRIGDSTIDRMPPGFMRGLSMARAFISPAKIILLDEPGASLDTKSDQQFVDQLKKLRGDKTIIMVSHRPSHIRLADKAILLDQGSINFIGTPGEAVDQLLEGAT